MTQSISNPFRVRIVTPGSSATPTWALAQPIGQWYTIPNTAPSLVAEPPQAGIPRGWQYGNAAARLDAWSGPAFRKSSSTLILGPCGGHGDYFMNWMSEFELGLETPQARLLHPGSQWNKLWPNATFAEDLNGPHATHSYYSHVFCDQRDWLMCWRLEARHPETFPFSTLTPAPSTFQWYWTGPVGNPIYTERVGVFDYSTKTWLPRNTVPDVLKRGSANAISAPYCVHPQTGDIFYSYEGDAAQKWYQWHQASNTHRVLPSSGGGFNYAATAVDPIRNRILFTGTSASVVIPRVIDCATGSTTAIVFTGPMANTVRNGDGGLAEPAMHWCDELGKFVFCYGSTDGNVRLVLIDPVNFTCEEFTAIRRPANPANGIQTKFQYAKQLRGVVLMNKYNEGIKYCRLW